MKADRAQTLVGVLAVLCGLLAFSTGRWIMGGIIILLAFGMFWNRGGGSINDRSIYENEVRTDLTIPALFEKLEDMDTPLGRAWIGEHKGYPGESIIFGPGPYKDMVVISKKSDKLNIKHITLTENITRSEADEYRFENLISSADTDVTPELYSKFAAYKLAAVMMIRHIRELLEDMSDGKSVSFPPALDYYNFYYHNSGRGWFEDADGSRVLRVSSGSHPFTAKLFNEDDEEMASVICRKFDAKGNPVDSAGFDLLANGESYGEIIPFKEKRQEGFIVKTEDGDFRLNLFPACSRANISCNDTVMQGDELKAVIGGSPYRVFGDGSGSQNDVVLSYDDDYLVLYATLEIFIMALNGRFLK